MIEYSRIELETFELNVDRLMYSEHQIKLDTNSIWNQLRSTLIITYFTNVNQREIEKFPSLLQLMQLNIDLINKYKQLKFL